ncbi:MAG: site-2 protease family protein [Candidatus Dormibacteria bacterium]
MGFDPSSLLLNALFFLPALLIGFTVHEFSHALVADLQGDRLPRLEGRLTLDPRHHLDPFGFIAGLLLGFGWARPVRVNPARLQDPWGRLAVSAAGPAANVVMALVFAAVFRILFPGVLQLPVEDALGLRWGMSVAGILYWVMLEVIQINLLLAIFNLIPLPPLDGYGVVSSLFRRRYPKFFYEVDLRGIGVLMAVLMIGFAFPALNVVAAFIFLVERPVLGALLGGA